MKKLVFENSQDKIALKIAGALLLLVVALQQLLPSNQPLPYARLNGSFTRIKSSSQIEDLYNSVIDEKLAIQVGSTVYTYRTGDLGISLNTQKSIQQFYPKSRIKRLIPFSVILDANAEHIPFYSSNKKALSVILSEIATKTNVPVTEANIQVLGNTLLVTPAKEGIKIDTAVSQKLILDAIASREKSVTLKPISIEPRVSTKKLQSSAAQFSAQLPSMLTIEAGMYTTSIDTSILLSWVVATGNPEEPLALNSAKIQDYATQVSREQFPEIAPTPTVVTIEDGKEISRALGKPGQVLDAQQLALDIKLAIENKTPKVTAKLVDAASPITYSRNYTKSSAGLQELLDQLTKNRQIGIRYIDINERGWDVSSGADTQFQMASTYKLFVAYSVFKRVDSGSLKLSDAIGDSTINDCLEAMIVNSDNTCALAFADLIGWDVIEAEGKALGAKNLNWTDDVYATTSDVAALLRSLAKNDILSNSSREHLLTLMKTQRFREGIPAGTEYEVADKVGFQETELHDGAIVYAPNLTHVLVIFTTDSSWQEIADITKQIEVLAS